MTRVTVAGLPDWVDADRLLGPGPWVREGPVRTAELTPREAADLASRLRNVHLGGRTLELRVEPPLPRALVRAARTEDARRRRDTTPGFTRAGVRLDPLARTYLTPEALALALGRRYAGQRVVDATCGAGGNAIGFARAGCAVVAVDANAARLAQARHNARIYGVEARIRFVHARAEHLDLDGDVLFVDPPWGTDWNRARHGRRAARPAGAAHPRSALPGDAPEGPALLRAREPGGSGARRGLVRRGTRRSAAGEVPDRRTHRACVGAGRLIAAQPLCQSMRAAVSEPSRGSKNT